MNDDNRISATLDPETVNTILGLVQQIQGLLPFLLTLSPQERREIPKMGEKSVGFDEKCQAYMQSNPEFIPGFTDVAEVGRDRDLRTQLIRLMASLTAMVQAVDDTLMQVSSEVWMADLAFYQSVREASRRGRAGALAIYNDLRSRFPGASGGAGGPETASEALAKA